MMRLTVLGSSSAIPTAERNLSAHYLEVNGTALLIDCGEATQMQISRFGKKLQAIEHIFISHLHGDHFFGLISLLSTMHMLDRQKPVHIYSPAGLEEVIRLQFKTTNTRLKFDLDFHMIHSASKVRILETNTFTVEAIPLKHSVEVYGFLIKEKAGQRNVRKSFVAVHSIPYEWFPRIKAGEDYVDENGVRYANAEITEGPKPPSSYAYFSDTAYLPERAEEIGGVSMLYHEATFLEEDADKAALRQHSTAKQAAQIAKMAGVDNLLIGHFSTRYQSVEQFEAEATSVFKAVQLAYDGLEIEF